jgi:putative hydrolase of the HAD superfamily
MAVRAVIFDLGHTVWDFAPTAEARRYTVLRTHERLARALGERAPTPRELASAIEAEAQRWFREWQERRHELAQPPSDRLLAGALESFGIELDGALLDELTALAFGYEPDIRVLEAENLAALATLDQRGLRLGCVTNTITTEAGIREVLRGLGLFRYFRSTVASSAAGYRKPHASLFRRALDELAVEAGEAVFVGDRLYEDIAGPQALGMRAVLTHQYRQEPPGAYDIVPDALIRRLAELPEAIERLDGAR